MVGESEELGRITVTLNPECLVTGQIRTPFDPYAGEGPSAKACRMAVGAIFDMPKLGMTLINRSRSSSPSTTSARSRRPEHPAKARSTACCRCTTSSDPDGEPVAYVTSLRFTMGGYLAPDEL